MTPCPVQSGLLSHPRGPPGVRERVYHGGRHRDLDPRPRVRQHRVAWWVRWHSRDLERVLLASQAGGGDRRGAPGPPLVVIGELDRCTPPVPALVNRERIRLVEIRLFDRQVSTSSRFGWRTRSLRIARQVRSHGLHGGVSFTFRAISPSTSEGASASHQFSADAPALTAAGVSETPAAWASAPRGDLRKGCQSRGPPQPPEGARQPVDLGRRPRSGRLSEPAVAPACLTNATSAASSSVRPLRVRPRNHPRMPRSARRQVSCARTRAARQGSSRLWAAIGARTRNFRQIRGECRARHLSRCRRGSRAPRAGDPALPSVSSPTVRRFSALC